MTTATGPTKPRWIDKLRAGLSRTSGKLSQGIASVVGKQKLDDATLEELEDLLISADLGPTTAAKLTGQLSETWFGREVDEHAIRTALADQIAKILEPVTGTIEIDSKARPHVILMVGVNGSGKTTTIGKFAHLLSEEGFSVMMAAGDTFRAAAVDQLRIWGERTGVPVVAKETGSDAASLAYEAFERARADGVEVLLIDTAGRLQNKTDLMAELQKIRRVLKKLDPDAPHSTMLVLDATTGQNAHSQVEVFQDMVDVTGLVLTKLDGSARGGVVVSLADKFHLPVHAIGVGEGIDDMRPFDAESFARSLLDLETDEDDDED